MSRSADVMFRKFTLKKIANLMKFDIIELPFAPFQIYNVDW